MEGLWGYNGALVGCAATVFLHPLPDASIDILTLPPVGVDVAVWGLASTVAGASIATFVGVGVGKIMGGVPQWAIAFNAIALGMILCTTQPLASTADTTASAEPTTTQAITSTTLLDYYSALI